LALFLTVSELRSLIDKVLIENCGQTAADGDIERLLTAYRKSPSPYPTVGYYRRLSTTYRLATVAHDWHTMVRCDLSKSSKVIDFLSFES